jgi:hypothetical protein
MTLMTNEYASKKAFLHEHALTGFTTRAYSFKRLALPRLPSTSPFSPDLMRVTYAHPLNPAALAFVPSGIVLVRVRVRDYNNTSTIDQLHEIMDTLTL